jgi:cell division protein FtsQ
MTPVAAPADKRFRRSRVSPARKRRWWPPSWWTVARVGGASIVVAFALYQTIGFVLASDALTVTRITVQGSQRMSRGEVLGLLDGLSGASIVLTDLESWRQKLLMSPWVADASIRRMFPGTLAVVIDERQPIGIGRIKGSLYLIDKTGTVIDEFGPNYSDLDLPIVDGLSPKGEADESVDEARAALAGRLMSELAGRPKLAGQVSQIDVTDSRNAIVLLKGDTALLRVGDQNFTERLQSYIDLMPALRERMPDIDYVDLRFDERVYVRPQASSGKRAPARRGG